MALDFSEFFKRYEAVVEQVDNVFRQVADQAAVAREARRNGQLDEQDEADVHDHDHDHA